jgi:hypothetical protein
VEVTIGVKHLPRELVIDTELTADAVATAVSTAFEKGTSLELTDARGRRYVVPAASIGYVEIGTEETRRVGFGTI